MPVRGSGVRGAALGTHVARCGHGRPHPHRHFGMALHPWRGVFYPPNLPQRLELEFASRMLRTIEINGSFYSLQRPESTPSGTTRRRRISCSPSRGRGTSPTCSAEEIDAARELLRVRGFQPRTEAGPVLWQFPPVLRFVEDRFVHSSRCCRATPRRPWLAHARRRSKAAIAGHRPQGPLRHAIEIRHASFLDPRFVTLLRQHGVALVIAETASRWPIRRHHRRFHVPEAAWRRGVVPQRLRRSALRRWAERIRAWSEGPGRWRTRGSSRRSREAARRASRDVYVYFDNDVKVHAPYDAATLQPPSWACRRRWAPRGEAPPGWNAPEVRLRRAPGFDRKRQPSTPASR